MPRVHMNLNAVVEMIADDKRVEVSWVVFAGLDAEALAPERRARPSARPLHTQRAFIRPEPRRRE